MISIGSGGAWATVTPYIGVGGVWKQITGYWIGVGGAWKSLAAPPLSVSVSPGAVSGSTKSSPATRHYATSGSCTVTASGGTGPYTYSWSVAFNPSGSIDTSGSCTANSPTSATTSFTGLTCNGLVSPGSDVYSAICTVTDTSNGATANVAVTVTLTNTYTS